MKLRHTASLATAISVLLYGASAHAITTVESNAGIQFNFSNPGARSLGMGGAFLGLADDATAAYSNPAGLSNLFRPEFSIEYRRTDFTTVYSDQGRLLGEPTGLGLDTVNGIVQGEAESDVDSVSFLSFVFPLEKWTFGAYRHQIGDFETFYRSEGPVVQTRGEQNGVPFLSRARPTENRVDLDIVNWGISTSYRITDNLSIGGGISYFDFEFDTETLRFPLEGGADRGNPADFSQPPDSSNTQVGDDDDIGFNVGLLWKITEKWSLGAVYRSGGEFEYTHQTRNLETGVTLNGITDFNLPSTFGVGVAFRPVDQLTLNFDYNRITYSDVTDNPVIQGSGAPFPELQVDDGNEYRLGLEYVFATANPIAIRAGVWQAPDTVLSYQGPAPEEALDSDPPGVIIDKNRRNVRAAFFQPGDDEIHYSIGAGFVIGRFQLDAAADFSDNNDTFSLSGVVFF